MIRLLLVEDSVTQREILRKLIDADGKLIVVAEARNGQEAVEFVARYQPDVVLMDIHMPDMDGVAATREIMNRTPVPIVITSASLKQQEVDLGLEALKAGAISVIEKPQGAVLLHLGKFAPQLCEELRIAAGARLYRRPQKDRLSRSLSVTSLAAGKIEVIGLCASTGGPPVLLKILSELPRPFPLPVLIVQHISTSFVPGFAKWLAGLSGQNVQLLQHNQEMTPGFWLSPGGFHVRVGDSHRIMLSAPRSVDIHCPSGNELFHSLAEHYGPGALGVLMTGMGDDGAEGLLALREAGGRTIAQDQESSLIYGMPKAAADRGAAQLQLPPQAISQFIRDLVRAGPLPKC